MGVSRSGYYKWKQRKPSKRDITRSEMIAIVKATHEEHPSHGYRWTAAFIRINLKVEISDNYAYKCFRFLGIKSKTKHKEHCRPRKEKDRYPNLIFSTWETVDRPKQVIVSDMTSYDTPANYRRRYYKGELEQKNTFAKRVLTQEPKFVQKRREKAVSEPVSTTENVTD